MDQMPLGFVGAFRCESLGKYYGDLTYAIRQINTVNTVVLAYTYRACVNGASVFSFNSSTPPLVISPKVT